MQKTQLEISGMSCQHCVTTETALTKTAPPSLRLIGGILIILLSIVGCSDMHYTGSMLTVEDVDRYITIGEDSVCLMSGEESACLTLIPETEDDSKPIIHIHPRKIIYVFYREGVQILQAEMVTDTTEIMEQVRDSQEDNQPSTDDDGDSTQEQVTPPPPPPPPPTDDGGSEEDDQPSTDDDGDSTQEQVTPPPPPLPPPPPPPPPPSNGGNTQNGGQNGGQKNGGDTQNGGQNGGNGSTDGTQQPDDGNTEQPDVSNPPTDAGDNNDGNNNGGNGNNNGNNGGDGNNGGTNANQKKIKVHGGSDAILKDTGLIYLEIRTGAHTEFPCANPLNVTAYTDMDLNVPRAHQHWSACRDATGSVTIFLYMHPALTCDTGPNIHILKIEEVTDPVIIIIEKCSPL